jgi:malate synthase
VLAGRPNQLERVRDDVSVSADDLLDTRIPGGVVTEKGLRVNVSIGVRYLASWLGGVGAAAIDNLMEDAATAEISRSQIWQWVHNGARLEDGRTVTESLVRDLAAEEISALGPEAEPGWKVFEQVALGDEFVEFLTIPAYNLID